MHEASIEAKSRRPLAQDLPPNILQKDAMLRTPSLGLPGVNLCSSTSEVMCSRQIELPSRADCSQPSRAPWFKGDVHLSFGDYDTQSGVIDRYNTPVLQETACTLSSLESASPHQSLLPPFPENLAYSNTSRSGQELGRVRCGSENTCKTGKPSAPDRAPLSQLEGAVTGQKNHTSKPHVLPAMLRRHPNAPMVTETPAPQHRETGTSLCSCSTVDSSCSTGSAMSSGWCSDGKSASAATGSPLSALTSNESTIDSKCYDSQNINSTHKRAAGVQFGNVASSRHEHSISFSLDSAASSPIVPPLEKRSPESQNSDVFRVPTANLPLVPKCGPQGGEVSAFDFDSEDERPFYGTKGLRKLVSRPYLKSSRSRVDTCQVATTPHHPRDPGPLRPALRTNDSNKTRPPMPTPSDGNGLTESPGKVSSPMDGTTITGKTAPQHCVSKLNTPRTSDSNRPLPSVGSNPKPPSPHLYRPTRPPISRKALTTPKLNASEMSRAPVASRPPMPTRAISLPRPEAGQTPAPNAPRPKGIPLLTAHQRIMAAQRSDSINSASGMSKTTSESTIRKPRAQRLRKLCARLVGKDQK